MLWFLVILYEIKLESLCRPEIIQLYFHIWVARPNCQHNYQIIINQLQQTMRMLSHQDCTRTPSRWGSISSTTPLPVKYGEEIEGLTCTDPTQPNLGAQSVTCVGGNRFIIPAGIYPPNCPKGVEFFKIWCTIKWGLQFAFTIVWVPDLSLNRYNLTCLINTTLWLFLRHKTSGISHAEQHVPKSWRELLWSSCTVFFWRWYVVSKVVRNKWYVTNRKSELKLILWLKLNFTD